MKPLYFTAVAAVFACASIACTGSVDDGTNESEPGSTPTSMAQHAAESTESADPGAESDGDDPFLSTVAAATTEEAPAADGEEPAPAEATKAAGELLATEAARQVAAMKLSSYEHTTFVEEMSGTFKYDCSGFLGYSLSRVLPTQLATVKAFASVARPLAKHFETFFASIEPGTKKGGWSRVARAVDVRAGDVVAWLKPAALESTNTGHVMIATGPATINPKRADEILIPIADSSSTFHGSKDSRFPEGNGLGRGSIGIIVDSKGAPVSYRWTGGTSAIEYSTAISFGRPV
jgi:hypothetical protein